MAPDRSTTPPEAAATTTTTTTTGTSQPPAPDGQPAPDKPAPQPQQYQHQHQPATQSGSRAEQSKYERLRRIGIGSYGVVFKCVNRQTGQIVAIKRYSENDSDPVIRKIAMREVRMLRQLKHPNLINLIEVFRGKRRLHLVFDYCELTVLDVIEKYADNCPLNLIKKITWQTVNAINYCHAHNCIHRDIKPENILINHSGVVKLCDFGFARHLNKLESSGAGVGTGAGGGRSRAGGVAPEPAPTAQGELATDETPAERQALTEYVATRWYRAPELLIGETHYDFKIDIWAIGCVTAELMRGKPMWPGKTDFDQLCLIKGSLGALTASQTRTLLSHNLYDQASLERLLALDFVSLARAESVEVKLPARFGQSGVHFVSSCLQMDPGRRPTSDALLGHSYIHSLGMAQFVRSHASDSGGASLATNAAGPASNRPGGGGAPLASPQKRVLVESTPSTQLGGGAERPAANSRPLRAPAHPDRASDPTAMSSLARGPLRVRPQPKAKTNAPPSQQQSPLMPSSSTSRSRQQSLAVGFLPPMQLPLDEARKDPAKATRHTRHRRHRPAGTLAPADPTLRSSHSLLPIRL